MSGGACARCDWRPDVADVLAPRLQLAEHADAAGHPLCSVCRRSLQMHERSTCETCKTAAVGVLDEVWALFVELPRQVGQVRAQAYDADRPGAADGRPLPGGEVLVLLSRGSEGLAEDGTTSRDGDPTSVAYELGWWANAWGAARRDGEVVSLGSSPLARPWPAQRQVAAAYGYLLAHTRWAAQHHGGFVAYVEDLRRLHGRLERATGRAEVVERAEAECFTCGADSLVRKQTDRGLEDHWTCGRCGATYDWRRYLLACRARVEDGRMQLRDVGWGTVRQVAAAVGVSVNTAKAWASRGTVTACCRVDSQELLLWYPEADERAKRNRRGERRAS